MKILGPNTLLQKRYLIVQLIGKGGMGEVYLAIDQRLGSTVALKRTFFADNESLSKAFGREAMILARLRHPVLPKVSDHFTEDELQYLVMEHISGDDLSKRLELSNQPFSVNWVLFWANQLLDVLGYLHSHEPPIIHRDIKPQNLKLTPENHVILLDFGLVKNTLGETRLSSTGSLSGFTPNYASMEQIRGTGTTAQSDIYSLSVTIYQLLTNRIPPDALTRADYFLNGLADPVVPIHQLNPGVSEEISDVILKGMNLSIDGRHRSAKEMQDAIREALNSSPQSNLSNTISLRPNLPVDSAPVNIEIQEEYPNIEHYANTLSDETFPPAQSNPAVTFNGIQFNGLMDDTQNSAAEILTNDEVSVTPPLRIDTSKTSQKNYKESPKIIPKKKSSSNKPMVRAIFGCTILGVLLTSLAFFTMKSTNSSVVPEQTVAPTESVTAPVIEDSPSPNLGAFNPSNVSTSPDETGSSDFNQSAVENSSMKKQTTTITNVATKPDATPSPKPATQNKPSHTRTKRDANKVF